MRNKSDIISSDTFAILLLKVMGKVKLTLTKEYFHVWFVDNLITSLSTIVAQVVRKVEVMNDNVFVKAFSEAVRLGEISKVSLSRRTGIDNGNISRFLSGKSGLQFSNLSSLFLALPYQAKRIFCQILLNDEIPDANLKLADLIARLDPNSKKDRKEAADAIRLIAEKMLK